jgi:Holliday junction resolvase RusA-like endonuclease
MSLVIIIRGQPVSKKNQMQMARTKTGRFFPVPSPAYRKWLASAKKQISPQTADYKGLPIDYPVHLQILAYRYTKRNIDLSNIYAAVEDMLQATGVLKNDSQVQSHDGSRKYLGVPEEDARVVVVIRKYEEPE